MFRRCVMVLISTLAWQILQMTKVFLPLGLWASLRHHDLLALPLPEACSRVRQSLHYDLLQEYFSTFLFPQHIQVVFLFPTPRRLRRTLLVYFCQAAWYIAADPASHRVRLWRGGSASKVPLHRVFCPRVRLHGHPEVCNGPWLLLWSRGGRRDCAAGGHRSYCDPVCSQSAPYNLMFFSQKMSLIICPVRQRLWLPVSLVASFVRRTQPGWSGSRPSVRRLLRSMWLLRVATWVLLLVGQVHALRRLCAYDCFQDVLNLLFSLLYVQYFIFVFVPVERRY